MWSKVGYMRIKLDMNKEYDRVTYQKEKEKGV
jgi:hypothetical protein